MTRQEQATRSYYNIDGAATQEGCWVDSFCKDSSTFLPGIIFGETGFLNAPKAASCVLILFATAFDVGNDASTSHVFVKPPFCSQCKGAIEITMCHLL